MARKSYKTEIHKIDHTTFGGIIYQSDFYTNYRGKDNTKGSCIAQHIVEDWNFDKRCKENRENILCKKWRK